MAPLPVIDDVFRTAWNWTSLTQQAVNVMNWLDTSGAQSPQDFVDDVEAEFDAVLFQMTDAQINDFSITKLDGVSATQIIAPTSPLLGNGAGPDFIPAASACLSIRTAKRGRSFRGRMYHPFVSENRQTQGTFDPADVALCVNQWNLFGAAMAIRGWNLGVASYLLSEFNAATSVSMDQTLCTQRRRQDRVGGF